MATNRDKVNELTDEQLAILIVHYMPKIGGRWTDSIFGIKEWLSDTALDEEWKYIRADFIGAATAMASSPAT